MPSIDHDTPYSLLLRLSKEIRDEQAWNEFVQRYQPHIRSWCCERGLQQADAEDVTQIVLEQLLTTMREFRYDPTRSFRAWLRTVTVCACNRFVLKESRASGRKDLSSLRLLDEAPARQELARRLKEAFDKELLEQAMETVRESVAPHTWEAFRLTPSCTTVAPRLPGSLTCRLCTSMSPASACRCGCVRK
jgi:RNA polymerase sigma factor (sigma-70 family)